MNKCRVTSFFDSQCINIITRYYWFHSTFPLLAASYAHRVVVIIFINKRKWRLSGLLKWHCTDKPSSTIHWWTCVWSVFNSESKKQAQISSDCDNTNCNSCSAALVGWSPLLSERISSNSFLFSARRWNNCFAVFPASSFSNRSLQLSLMRP